MTNPILFFELIVYLFCRINILSDICTTSNEQTMISKEEENQSQNIAPSGIAVHLAAAYAVSEKKIHSERTDNRQSLNVFIVNDNDHKIVMDKNGL